MKHVTGFTLVELLIAMSIGLVLIGSITSVLLQHKVNYLQPNAQLQLLNKAMLLRNLSQQKFANIGYNNPYDLHLITNPFAVGQITTKPDTTNEAFAWPIAFAGDFLNAPQLGTQDGELSADTLVFHQFDHAVCTGAKFKHSAYQADPTLLYHSVEQYFIEHNNLRCRAYDGGFLSGHKDKELASNAVTLINNVVDFQVQFLLSYPEQTQWQWLNPSEMKSQMTDSYGRDVIVAAVKLTFLLRSDISFYQNNQQHLLRYGEQAHLVNDDASYLKTEFIVAINQGSRRNG